MNMFKVAALVLGGLLPLAATVAPARAQSVTFDWSISNPDAANQFPLFYTGSGTLTATMSSGGDFVVSAISGTVNGFTVTGLLNSFSIGDNDNAIVAASSFNGYVPDQNGIGFKIATGSGTVDIDILNTFSPFSSLLASRIDTAFTEVSNSPNTDNGGIGLFTLTQANAVPEPASMALLGAGLFGLGMVRRRRG